MPDLVEHDEPPGGAHADYRALIAHLIEAVKELDERLQEVENGSSQLLASGDERRSRQIDYAALLAPVIEAVQQLDQRLRAIEQRRARE